jgi:hypothetical protein
MKEKTILTVVFTVPVMTVKEYIDFSKYILLELKGFDSFFSKYKYWDNVAKKTCKFNEDLSGFESIMFDQLYDDDVAYLNMEKADKEYKYTSKSPFGFSNVYIPDLLVESNANISIDISEDNLRYSFINIEFPIEGFDHFYDFQYCNNLLRKLIDLVDASYAAIIPRSLSKLVSYDKNSDNKIGWITYFNNKEVVQFLPKNILTENFKGGIIFFLTKNFFDVSDDDIVNKATQIKNSLYPTGILSGG